MNQLNSSNSKDIITQVLQEILQEDPNYFLPKQLHVLSWKSKTISNALITKVNGQKYLGLLRKDIKGQGYWKYKPLTNSENSEGKRSQFEEQSSTSAEIKPEQQSIEQEQSPDNFAQSKLLEQNPQVQKFREKYGTPHQSQKST